MNAAQLEHYKQKLAFETDSWDLFEMLGFEVRELMGGLDWWKRDGYATEGVGAQTGTEIACGC